MQLSAGVAVLFGGCAAERWRGCGGVQEQTADGSALLTEEERAQAAAAALEREERCVLMVVFDGVCWCLVAVGCRLLWSHCMVLVVVVGLHCG